MLNLARGYIASGEFNGNRAPQHLQNQVSKLLRLQSAYFCLSRAEYWINGSTQCQLGSSEEGYKNIVFFSLWQLPVHRIERENIYKHCTENQITLHFATERLSTNPEETSIEDIEVLYQTNLFILNEGNNMHLNELAKLL